MAPVYSQACLTNRLAAVQPIIDAGSGNGSIVLFASSSPTLPISTITLPKPRATAAGGILTFGGTLQDNSIARSGTIVVISGLTVGTSNAGADIVISNSAVTVGQVLLITSATITGS